MASLLFCKYMLNRIACGQYSQIFRLAAYAGQMQQKRFLNVLEHLSYKILNDAGINTPKFDVAKTGPEASDIAKKLGTPNIVLKAQVLAGGRGKGKFKNGLKGGVRAVSSPKEANEIASKMVNQILVTKQTGPEGKLCSKVMVAERKFPRREFYFSVMLERAFNGPVIIASSQGGVNIEDIAAENPDAIIYEPVKVECGLTTEQAEKIAIKVGLEEHKDKIVDMLMKLYNLFVEKDALLVEINPYAEDAVENCSFFALDAKFRFDDNAQYRQKEIFAMRDFTQEDPKEVEAAKNDLSYIALDGNIGCMVNGAGLAMATMDVISLYGGKPANFLDVGGTATPQSVERAFKIITSDPKVVCILVNIFGGIIRCDLIAEGIIAAAQHLKLQLPVVVRLQGTKSKEALDLINKSGMRIISRPKLPTATKIAVRVAKIIELAREMKMDVKFIFPEHKGTAKGEKEKCESPEPPKTSKTPKASKAPKTPKSK